MSKPFAPRSDTAPAGTTRSIVVFSGGRGCDSILRAALRVHGVRVTVLVNAYDDGLSTGRLRGFVPGMLGASDFRKNLAHLLELSSPAQFAVAALLEYRFPSGSGLHTVDALLEALRSRAGPLVPGALADRLGQLDVETAGIFSDALAAFATYARGRDEPFALDDCALGNLVLAGAYLRTGRSFNAAVAHLCRALRSQADVVNVTTGENRILVALKADGEILERESRIVGPQSDVPIRALYLLPGMLRPEELARLAALDVEGRAAGLAALHRDVELSPEARDALERADVIVYGPGTQHSSLLPSYLTRGLADVLAKTEAATRAFVVNLENDHDTSGLGPAALVDRALDTLGDPTNERALITDILCSSAHAARSGFGVASYKGARVVTAPFETQALPVVHNGAMVVERLLALVDAQAPASDNRLELYVDLHRRSLGLASLLQEFVETPWSRAFAHVRLRVNSADVAERVWPPHLAVESTRHRGLFSEVEELLTWLRDGTARFHASLTGDGEYRLRDLETAFALLRSRRFGAIFGARNQSRQQFFGSLRHAYAGRRLMYAASVAGGFGVAAVCAARFGIILSDPLTGFRVYDRLAIPDALGRDLLARPPGTTLEVTRRLVDHRVEIAEVPVSYRSYPAFTDERWRLSRGLRNAVSVLP